MRKAKVLAESSSPAPEQLKRPVLVRTAILHASRKEVKDLDAAGRGASQIDQRLVHETSVEGLVRTVDFGIRLLQERHPKLIRVLVPAQKARTGTTSGGSAASCGSVDLVVRKDTVWREAGLSGAPSVQRWTNPPPARSSPQADTARTPRQTHLPKQGYGGL